MNTATQAAYEGDIVSRLRNWRGLHLAHSGELFEEAADEIEALQLELHQEARINGMGGEREARLMAIIAERESEIARLRLTDMEREAIVTSARDDEAMAHQSRADTLRGLLERVK